MDGKRRDDQDPVDMGLQAGAASSVPAQSADSHLPRSFAQHHVAGRRSVHHAEYDRHAGEELVAMAPRSAGRGCS
jgi:hypothetical protein